MGYTSYEAIKDYRVGVALDLIGVATSTSKTWVIRYIGNYGFAGDPAAHYEEFKTLKEAAVRWKELAGDYANRSALVNRLKAFRKPWVPESVRNYEAVLWERDGLIAVLASQGPKSRRKRYWTITVAAPKLGIKMYSRMIVPGNAGPAEAFPAETIRPPLSRMPEVINRLWGKFIKAFAETR